MKVGLSVRIDVTKIDKSRLYKGAKSRYFEWCDKHSFQWSHKVLPEAWLAETGKRTKSKTFLIEEDL